jgi:hypothetical protein
LDSTGVGAAYLSNVFVGTIYDSGIVGLSLLLAGLALIIKRASVNRRVGLLVVIVLLVTSAATNQLWLTFPWALLGLLSSENSKIQSKSLNAKMNELKMVEKTGNSPPLFGGNDEAKDGSD